MMRYEVQITERALQKMEELYHYIAIELSAPENALGQYKRIKEKVLSLETFPERCRIMESEFEKKLGFRKLLVDNYAIIYFIEDNRVVVVNVLYSASDIEARLKNE